MPVKYYPKELYSPVDHSKHGTDNVFELPFCKISSRKFPSSPYYITAWKDYWEGITNITPVLSRYIERMVKEN